jgi:hypothetical protein
LGLGAAMFELVEQSLRMPTAETIINCRERAEVSQTAFTIYPQRLRSLLARANFDVSEQVDARDPRPPFATPSDQKAVWDLHAIDC